MIAFASVAHAWEPTGPVTVVISAPAGSLHDRAFKTVLPTLEQQTGVEFIINYTPGASGVKGTKYFLSMPKDDHTILVTAGLSQTLNEIAMPKVVDYNYETDFVYAGGFVASALGIAASEDGKIDSIDDFVALLKSGKPVTVATTYPNQVALVKLMASKLEADTSNLKFIKYKNPAEALTDIVGGSVDVFVGAIAPVVPLYKAGKMRFIAVTSSSRLSYLPDVPAINETFKGVDMPTTMGVALAAGTSEEVRAWYEAALIKAVRTQAAEDARAKGFFYVEDQALTGKGLFESYQETRRTWESTYKEIFSE